MEESEQYILEDQAINVLSLFPKRQTNILMPSLSLYSKLFQSLTCSICREIFTNPVYLKCSHRFCKECIEKYIRSNTRKSCPNCRGGLTTKRDLRSDFSIQSLITFAFGDAKKMSKQFEEIERVELSQLERERPIEMKKVESMTDVRGKRANDQNEEFVVAGYLKRSKTTDVGEEIVKRRKREPNEKKLKNAIQGLVQSTAVQNTVANVTPEVEKESTPARKARQVAQTSLKRQEGQVNILIRQKKKKSQVVIQIDSSQPVQVEQIPPEVFFNAQQNIAENSNSNKIASLMCSISMIPEVSQIQSARKIASIREVEKEDVMRPEENDGRGNEMIAEEQPMPQPELQMREQMQVEQQQQTTIIAEPFPVIPPQVIAARESLRQQFGGTFLNKILQLTDYPVFMRIFLSKHPSQPFTPSLTFQQLKISARATALSILSIIAEDLNINKEAIKLFVCQQQQNSYIEVSNGTKMHEINNRFWRSFAGFEILELGQYIEVPDRDEDLIVRGNLAWHTRILYFSVDYSKITL